jgi:chromosome segregation ATPase
MRPMDQERTRELHETRSFEERLFARFDVMDRRLDVIDGRLDTIDGRLDGMGGRLNVIDGRLDAIDRRLDNLDSRVQILEAKAYDTKPIWERALAEILNLRERLESIERKFDLLTLDMMDLRGDHRRLEGQFDALKSRPA